MSDWESEVRWNRWRRSEDPSPFRARRRWCILFWLSLALNVVLAAGWWLTSAVR